MNKGGRFTPIEKQTYEIETVNQALEGMTKPWREAGMELPTFSLKEVSRVTDLNPLVIARNTLSLESDAAIVGMGSNFSEWLKKTRTPRPSKRLDRLASIIWREGQRYQRRPQFPSGGAVGKPTRRRVESRVAQYQISQTKITIRQTNLEEAKKQRRLKISRKRKERAVRQLTREMPNLKSLSRIFQVYDLLGNTGNISSATQRAFQSWEKTGIIDFFQFTCPRINATALFGPCPKKYLLTDPSGNNFESTINRLKRLAKSLTSAGFKFNLTIIIGDTDEPDYIFPVLKNPSFTGIEKRKSLYALNFTYQTRRQCSGWLEKIDIYQWSEIAELLRRELGCPPEKQPNMSNGDYQAEITRMRESFSPGNYYDGLPIPTNDQLTQMVNLKFLTYAQQGRASSILFPSAILLQNEFPRLLRTKMLNSQIEDPDKKIVALYPYGRSNSLY